MVIEGSNKMPKLFESIPRAGLHNEVLCLGCYVVKDIGEFYINSQGKN